MEGYEVLVKPSAVKEIERLPTKKDRGRIVTRIEGLSADPRPAGCEKLSGLEKYRVRQGYYRVVYEVEDARRTVLVVKVGHRRGVYR